METTLQETKKRQSTSPKLTCLITGKVRPSNEKYLASKAEKKGVSVEYFTQTYVCKQAVKRLRAGMSVEAVRAELDAEVTTPISSEQLQDILRINGKSKN